jgi:ADP-ribosyl-[dinitrogen reductase] hydrolase
VIREAPPPSSESATRAADRLAGTLLGVALGDALGLPCEGMSARSIARRFGIVDRFRLLGQTGFVSDDTEQAALISQSLAHYPHDQEACVRAFRRALLGWFCRLPWGVGLATVKSCIRIALGVTPSGVVSAGNGAAMRAAIIGVFFNDRLEQRLTFGRTLAQVTHRDERAVEGALFVAELAANLSHVSADRSWERCVAEARTVVTHTELGAALDRAMQLAIEGVSTADGARVCGTTGFVLHTVPFATFCLLRHGGDPMRALSEAIGGAGDTDSIAAILGGWLGALHGPHGLPPALIARIHDGPFGPTHLRALASCLCQVRVGADCPVPRYSAAAALVRNLALYPVILAHGFRRLVPF